jgi:predicted ATP-grasp superfamily ATP-dependent carboligase
MHFSGWPDAGEMIEFTLAELKSMVPVELVAEWDLEGFWQTESIRPLVHVHHGQIKRLEWPQLRFFLGRYGEHEPFLVGTGVEPSRDWRGFTREMLALLEQWGCREIVLLGSLYDQIFHDEVVLSAVVQDTQGYNEMRELGCEPAEYVGPGSIHAAVLEATQNTPMRCVSIWTHLPFYLRGPHELTSARCLEIIGALLGFTLDPVHLRRRWDEREGEIEELIHNNQELRQAIEVLKNDRHRRKAASPNNVLRMDDFMKKRQDPHPDED